MGLDPALDALPNHARIASDTPGRLRLRVHRPLRHTHATGRVQAQLRARRGIHGVETNTTTGSVMVHYDPRTLSRDDILTMLHDVGLIVADLAGGGEALPDVEDLTAAGKASEPGHSRAAGSVIDAVSDLDLRLHQFTGGKVDLRLLFPLGLGAIGLYKVLRHGFQLSEVPAYVLLWYAFDAFFKLHLHFPDQRGTSAGVAGEATATPRGKGHRAGRARGGGAADVAGTTGPSGRAPAVAAGA